MPRLSPEDEDAALDECMKECNGKGQEFIQRQLDKAMCEVFAGSRMRDKFYVGIKLGDGEPSDGYAWVTVGPGKQRLVKVEH